MGLRGFIMDDQGEQDGGGVATLGMFPPGDPRNQGYDLPAYNTRFSDADIAGMPSYSQPQAERAPMGQGMSQGLTGQGNAPYTLDDIQSGALPPGMATFGAPQVQHGDLPPMNTSFNVDAAGQNDVRNLMNDQPSRYGGGMMTIGGQTTAIMNPLAQGQGQASGGAGAPAGTAGGQQAAPAMPAAPAQAPAQDPFAAIDAPVINRAADQARREQEGFYGQIARRTAAGQQLEEQRSKLEAQQAILPKGLALWGMEQFVKDFESPDNHKTYSRTEYGKAKAAQETLAHKSQIEAGLDDLATRKSGIDAELRAFTSGPTPPSPQEAAQTTGAALKARRAAAQAKAGQTQAQAQAQKDWSDQSAELGRINKDMLPKAQKALAALNNSGTPERKAISDQVRASGIKPDGTDAGDKKYQDAVKAAMKPAQAKAQADIDRMTARRDQLAASTKNRPGSTGSKSGAQGAASSVVDDRNQAFGIVKSKKPEWSDAQVNAYLDSKEGQ